MKSYFLLFLLYLTGGFFASAQKPPVEKMYAYIQTVLPGQKKNVIVEENGNTIETTAPKKMNYYFFAEKKETETIRVVGIWMYGKKYNVQVDKVAATPIDIFEENTSNDSGKISLSPEAGYELMQVLPGAATTRGTKLSGYLKKMVQQSELVLIYAWKGETWYFPVKKIKNLSPLASV